MHALEFETYIQNGQIILPDLLPKMKQKVRIILLWQEEEGEVQEVKPNKFSLLKQAMKQLQELKPFSQIADPMEWQRQIRNEW